MPEHGQNIYDINGPLYKEIVEKDAAEKGDGWRWPLPEYEVLSQFLRRANIQGLGLCVSGGRVDYYQGRFPVCHLVHFFNQFEGGRDKILELP